jgi:hypothetical protein
VKDVVEVLAFGEPLGVPLLVGLTDAIAVEQAEAQGLVEVYPDRRRYHSPHANAKSSPWPPTDCPTAKSPTG